MGDGSESKPVAVVTGGNGFIGSAIVRHLTASGHDVVVLDREGEFSADLGSEADVRRVSRRVLGTLLTWMSERKESVFVGGLRVTDQETLEIA